MSKHFESSWKARQARWMQMLLQKVVMMKIIGAQTSCENVQSLVGTKPQCHRKLADPFQEITSLR